MPEYLRSFVVIIIIAGIMLMIVKPVLVNIVSARDFNRRVSLWFIITMILFLSNNFWIYLIGAAFAIQLAKANETNYVALFFILLFATPAQFSVDVPGFGVLNYLFAINHFRLLELLILMPMAFILAKRSDTLSFGRTTPDKFLIVYLLLTVLLQLRETTLTDTLRQGFYSYIDILLPYYVASRALRNMEQFRDAIGSFVIAGLILAGIAIFEGLKHWLLYSALSESLGLTSNWAGYMGRGGSLRAMGSAGHPIVLGYVMMVALGFYLYLRQFISKMFVLHLVLAVLAGGLFAAVSRGPWIGMAIFVIVFFALGPNALHGLAKVAVGVTIAVMLVLVLPGGERLIDLLPYIGSIESNTISYRERLFEMGMIVIQKNLWLGSVNFLNTAEMESMRQGHGIIDLVNTYLGIALRNGLVGFGLFAGFFLSVLLGIYSSFQSIKSTQNDEYVLGVTLFAILLAILATIATVSSILVIPVVYWSVAGMGVAYIQVVNRSKNQDGK